MLRRPNPSTPVPPDDLLLQHRFQRGDEQAFTELVSPYLAITYTVCLRICGDRMDAQDMYQETLFRALRAHASFVPGRPMRPWLLTIARNTCRSFLRSPRHLLVSLVPWPARFSDAQQDQASPELLHQALDRDHKVRQALSTLPLKYREAITLFHLDDMSYAEMAEITGVRVAALKQRVRRGSAMLKGAMLRLYPELVPGE